MRYHLSAYKLWNIINDQNSPKFVPIWTPSKAVKFQKGLAGGTEQGCGGLEVPRGLPSTQTVPGSH